MEEKPPSIEILTGYSYNCLVCGFEPSWLITLSLSSEAGFREQLGAIPGR